MSRDGKKTLLTGTDSDRTSLQLNLWVDTAYHLPSASKPNYLQAINRVIRRERVQAVFPQPDTEVRRISKERNKLDARVFLPDEATVSTCLDKFQALRIWNGARLRKEPVMISPRDESRRGVVNSLEYPCWLRAREGAGGLLSCKATSPAIVDHWTQFYWDQGIEADFVAEEYLPGRDFCFMSIWNRGSLVTSMIRERLSWVGTRLVGTGGTSKLNRVVHSAAVNKRAIEAIQSITRSPHGIFCVDLKEDPKGVACPTEINCRFTTNVHYLTLASIKLSHPEWNFPWLVSRLMLDEEIPECAKTNALPSNLSFTKNTDMGFIMVEGNHWKAREPI